MLIRMHTWLGMYPQRYWSSIQEYMRARGKYTFDNMVFTSMEKIHEGKKHTITIEIEVIFGKLFTSYEEMDEGKIKC